MCFCCVRLGPGLGLGLLVPWQGKVEFEGWFYIIVLSIQVASSFSC